MIKVHNVKHTRAFILPILRGDYQKLLQQGVSFLSEHIEFRPDVWIVYFRGPDGEVGELRETPSGKTSS